MLSAVWLLGSLIGAVIGWLATSLAVFFAARIVVGSRAKFTKALALTLVGVVVLSLFSLLVSALLSPLSGFVLAFLMWLWLIKSFFQTGWLGAFGISILAVFMFIIVNLVLGFLALLVGLPFLYQPAPAPTWSL